ncbi:hypothetical protein [Selenomonas sp. AB3002]|uniref:hypothetical protein n=1 Tax=Selenomonas sp. AB3002 TaxID=1392502 RepID=UPI000495E01A
MFVFNCENIIDYDDYVIFLTSLKNDFNAKKKILFDNYNIISDIVLPNKEYYFEFRDMYRDLRQYVIKTVLSKFRAFLPDKCLIYEFGSLTKHTDRIESDTDLTICYDEKKKEIYENVEELINYSIINIFEHPIDHIHGKFQHYPITHEYDYLSESDNLYILKFDNGNIQYKCRQESLSENIMSIKNVRNYDALIEGYEEKYKLRCNIDCLYSIEILENTTPHDFLGDLSNLEIQNDIFLDYKYYQHIYYFDGEVEVSYLKRAFKDTIVSMYIMISFLRRKLDWLSGYSMNMNDVFYSRVLCEYFGEKYIEDLRKNFINMIFYWDKIELLLKRINIPLSTKCHLMFSTKELDDMLYNEYHIDNMTFQIIDSINSLSNIVSRGWELINKNDV